VGPTVVGYVGILLFLSDDALDGQKQELVRLVLGSNFGTIVNGKVMLEIARLRNLTVK
jgi:hypothetical protein